LFEKESSKKLKLTDLLFRKIWIRAVMNFVQKKVSWNCSEDVFFKKVFLKDVFWNCVLGKAYARYNLCSKKERSKQLKVTEVLYFTEMKCQSFISFPLGAVQIIRDTLGGGGVSKNVTWQFFIGNFTSKDW
jgi:hypothetical protein